jgi:hypothetical protein
MSDEKSDEEHYEYVKNRIGDIAQVLTEDFECVVIVGAYRLEDGTFSQALAWGGMEIGICTLLTSALDTIRTIQSENLLARLNNTDDDEDDENDEDG